MLVDTHAHLDDPKFENDVDGAVSRAAAAGVTTIVTVGTDRASTEKAIALAYRFSNVCAAAGCHPHEADVVKPADVRAWLIDLGRDPRVVGIGETGLDTYKRFSSIENQRALFEAHIDAARELDKPIIVHCRDAHAETIEILERAKLPRGVIHCFSGSADDARRYLAMGFTLSIAGPVTYPNAKLFQSIVRGLPLERLVVETDCPYLAPQPRRGQRNEPAFTRFTAEFIAQLHATTLESFAASSTRAARSLFNLP